MKTIDQCRLYTFVDMAYLHGRSPADVARALCDGGSDIVQLRAKQSSASEVQRLAEMILPITSAAKVPLVINDFPEVARDVGAQVVHLGQEDFFDAGFGHRDQVKALHGQLGLSSHSPLQAQRAMAAGADYIAVGPVFATGTKPGREPVTLEYVRWATANVAIPWFAIGGISLANLDDVLAAGARRICVVSAILNAPDLVRACHEFKQRLTSAPL